MNPIWIALLTVFVLLKRAFTSGMLVTRVAGSLLVLGGLGLTLSELTHYNIVSELWWLLE